MRRHTHATLCEWMSWTEVKWELLYAAVLRFTGSFLRQSCGFICDLPSSLQNQIPPAFLFLFFSHLDWAFLFFYLPALHPVLPLLSVFHPATYSPSLLLNAYFDTLWLVFYLICVILYLPFCICIQLYCILLSYIIKMSTLFHPSLHPRVCASARRPLQARWQGGSLSGRSVGVYL